MPKDRRNENYIFSERSLQYLWTPVKDKFGLSFHDIIIIKLEIMNTLSLCVSLLNDFT